jgi:ubiquinol-cytochrome c reductase cytochrome c1 subunit
MLRKAIVIAAAGLSLIAFAAPASAETKGEHPHAPKGAPWSFAGPFGKFDQAELQRGYKVYKEVCAQCHSMNLLSFRNLGEKGGPFYKAEFKNPNDNPYVKALAADVEVADIDTETGDPMKRPGTSADKFPSPYPNEYAAFASLKAVPPDLSLIVKARHSGSDYVYSLLTGYHETPRGLKQLEGKFYNPYYPGDMGPYWSGDKKAIPEGGFISMKPPLEKNKVTFDDGTPSTLENQARAVSAFLTWASEPKQTERKQVGLAVMIYLLLLAGLVYASYRRVWRNESH